MERAYSVKLTKLSQNFDLKVLRQGRPMKNTPRAPTTRTGPACSSPAFYYFYAKRLQVLGCVEITYLEAMPPEQPRGRFDRRRQGGIRH